MATGLPNNGMLQTFPVGQAPWETASAGAPQSFPVGQAPWETNNTPTPTPLPTPTPSPYGALSNELGNFSVGVAQSEGSLLRGVGSLVQGGLRNTVGRLASAISGKGFVPSGGSDIYDNTTPLGQQAAQLLQPKGTAQTLGNVAGNIGIGAAGLATGNPETILGSAAQLGGLSAAQTGLQSIGIGNDLKTAAKDAFVSGMTGAIAGAAGKVISNTVQTLAEKAPEAFYNNALKVLNKIKVAGNSPADFLQNEGVWGNLGTFQKAASEGIAAENTAIKQAALGTEGGLTYDDVIQTAAKDLQDKLGDLYSPQEINQLVQSVPLARLKNAQDIVPWADVDGVRVTLGKYIGNNKWLSQTPSENTQAAEAVYRALSSAEKDATGTTENFARLSQWIRTNKVVGRAVGLADNKYGLGLLDTISGAGGAIASGFGSQGDIGTRLKDAAIGGATGLAIERGVNSPALKTGLGLLLSHLNDLPLDTLGDVGKQTVTQLINEFTRTTPQFQQSGQ